MEDLVVKVRSGDKSAIRELYEYLLPMVRSYLRVKITDDNDVDEVAQEVMLSVFESINLYRGQSSIKTFVLSIARHEVADWYRKRYVRKVVEKTAPLLEEMVGGEFGPELRMEKEKIKVRFKRAYAQMSQKQQDILSYRYELGMSVKEIAKRMSLSVKATESLLYRTRMAFRRVYEGGE